CLRDATSKTAVNQKVDPRPSWLSTPMAPPIIPTSCLQIARPSPVPPYLRVVDASAWTNGENSVATWSGRMPIPVSVMAKRTVAMPARWLSSATSSVTSPRSVNLTALAQRLMITWRRRCVSPRRNGGISGDTRARISIPFADAWTRRGSMTSSIVSNSSRSRLSRVTFRASILERSRMLSIRASRVRPLVWATAAYRRCSPVRSVSTSIPNPHKQRGLARQETMHTSTHASVTDHTYAAPTLQPRVIIEYQRARRLHLIPLLRAEVYLLQFRQRRFPARPRGALPRGAGARDPRPRLGLDSRNGLPGRRYPEQSRARCSARAARPDPRTSLGGSHHRSCSRQHRARHRPRLGRCRHQPRFSRRTIFRRKGTPPHRAHAHRAGRGRRDCGAARRGHTQHQYRPDRRALRPDRSFLARISRLGGAPRAGTRLRLHARSG